MRLLAGLASFLVALAAQADLKLVAASAPHAFERSQSTIVITPCDGRGDDTAAIQAAIDAASRAAILEHEWGQGAGDVVRLPRGVCRITKGLVVRGVGVTLTGAGVGSTTLRAEVGLDHDAITFDANKTGIRDLTVYAQDRRRMRDGVRFVGRSWHRMENVSVYYAGRYGVNVERPLDFQLDNVYVKGAGEAGLRVDADPQDGTEGTTFRANGLYVLGSPRGGVLVGHVFGATFTGLISEYNGPTAWEPGKDYDFNDVVTSDRGKVYECLQPGQTARSGGPTGSGASIADGGARWRYLGTFHPEENYGLKVTGMNPVDRRRGSAEVTLIQPYFERNRGWDMVLGVDPRFASMVTVIAPEHRNDVDRADGYGAVLVDHVRGGGIFGGNFANLMPGGGLSILFTPRALNFPVFATAGASAANMRYGPSGSVNDYPGLIAAYDEKGGAQLYGRYVPRAAGTPLGSGTAPPVEGSWPRGTIWLNTTAGVGAPAGWVCITAGTPGTWAPLPGAGQPQTDSSAADVAALRADLNALLAKLRASGSIGR